MIVSASYRTDIPAFYSNWFQKRLKAGYCRVVNPYGGPVQKIALTPDAVAGFVFWTRNPGPFRAALREVARRGMPFAVQVTATGYPRALEASVLPPERSVALVGEIHRRYGPRAAVWRYDPVLITSATTPAWHRRNFAALARQFAGKTDEVVFSFAQIYAKTRSNLNRAAQRHGFAWNDPPDEDKRALLAELAAIARDQGLKPTLCAQPNLVGADPRHCSTILGCVLQSFPSRSPGAIVRPNAPGRARRLH